MYADFNKKVITIPEYLSSSPDDDDDELDELITRKRKNSNGCSNVFRIKYLVKDNGE